MKLAVLTLVGLFLGLNIGYGQFDQEPQKESKIIEETVEKAIDKIEALAESIDIEEFFEEDLPVFIEGIKPSTEEIEHFEQRIRSGVACMREFDASIIDEIIEDISEGTEEIIEDVEEEIDEYKRSKRKISKL